MTDTLMMLADGFFGGMLNAVAGGGTFITFPALVASGVPAREGAIMPDVLGGVDKRDSQGGLIVIQAGTCNGDQIGTRPDVGRGMGVS